MPALRTRAPRDEPPVNPGDQPPERPALEPALVRGPNEPIADFIQREIVQSELERASYDEYIEKLTAYPDQKTMWDDYVKKREEERKEERKRTEEKRRAQENKENASQAIPVDDEGSLSHYSGSIAPQSLRRSLRSMSREG